jgi:hypothetical protein
VSLFGNPRFTAASASVAIAFFALLGFIFLMTQYFQVVRGYSPLATGVRLLPVAASVGVAAVADTRLAVRAGNKAIVGGGMAFLCAALLPPGLPGPRRAGPRTAGCQQDAVGRCPRGRSGAPVTGDQHRSHHRDRDLIRQLVPWGGMRRQHGR